MSVRSGSPVHELIQLYDDRVAAGTITEPLGWRNQKVDWVIKINNDGTVRCVDRQTERADLMTQPLTSRSSGLCPLLAHDSLKYLHDPKAWDIWMNKHLGFQDRIKFPAAFVAFLNKGQQLAEGDKLWNVIWAQTLKENPKAKKEKELKVLKKALMGKPFVIELPDLSLLHNHAGVKAFWNPSNILEWQNYGKKEKDQDRIKMGYSSITGKWSELAPFHAAIGSCVPGAQAVAKIGSINLDASCYHSYGQEGAFCVPMTIEETFKLSAIIQDLAKYGDSGKSCVRMLAGRKRKFSVWKNRMDTINTLILAWGPQSAIDLFDLGENSTQEAKTKALDMVKFLSGHGGGEIPEVQKGDQVHFLALSAKSGGRIAIEDYWYEDVPAFADRMSKWYECNMLYRDGVPTYAGPWSCTMAMGLPKASKGYSQAQYHACRQLQAALYKGGKIPADFKVQARKASISVIEKGGKEVGYLYSLNSPFRLFRACRVMEGTQYEKGGFTMMDQSVAYLLGKLVVEMDDAKQWFDFKTHKKARQFELTPTTKGIMRTCQENPSRGLRCIREKMEVYDSWKAADIGAQFDALPKFLGQKEKDDFISGMTAGLADRKQRMIKAKEAKVQKKLGESNAAA